MSEQSPADAEFHATAKLFRETVKAKCAALNWPRQQTQIRVADIEFCWNGDSGGWTVWSRRDKGPWLELIWASLEEMLHFCEHEQELAQAVAASAASLLAGMQKHIHLANGGVA